MCRDCRFDVEKTRFQFRVSAVIIEEDHALLAKCDKADYYYSVGGAVKMGETAEEAVVREVFEETGIHYEPDRLLFVQENFFKDDVVLQGFAFHEVSLHFLMKPKGQRRKIEKESFCSAGAEHMHWIPIQNLSQIKMFPAFYPEKLLNLPESVEHIITDEIGTKGRAVL